MATSAASELTPRAREIVAAARELLESEGEASLSMRRLATRLGIKAPSLYKHFADKEALEAALIADGFRESAEAFETAVAGCSDALEAIARAYRAYARAHPHLYRLMTDRPLPRHLLPAGLEERAATPIVQAVGGDRDTARAAWAFAHGMVSLELNERFPPDADLDAAWRRGLGAFRPQG